MPKVDDKHRAARRRQILEAALFCFSRNGFHVTSMRDICRRAQLSPGAVYLYFPSKESILAALAEAGRDQSAHWVSRCKGLAEVVAEIERQLGKPEELPVFRLDVSLWGEAIRDPRLAELYRQAQAALADAIAKVAMESDRKRTRRQARAIAQLLVAAVCGLELQKAMHPEADLRPALAFLKAAVTTI